MTDSKELFHIKDRKSVLAPYIPNMFLRPCMFERTLHPLTMAGTRSCPVQYKSSTKLTRPQLFPWKALTTVHIRYMLFLRVLITTVSH